LICATPKFIRENKFANLKTLKTTGAAAKEKAGIFQSRPA
jgi:hypothetical protein